jgi:hypothetical protein
MRGERLRPIITVAEAPDKSVVITTQSFRRKKNTTTTTTQQERLPSIDEADRHVNRKGLKMAGEFIMYPPGVATFSLAGFSLLVDGLSSGEPAKILGGLGCLVAVGACGKGIANAYAHYQELVNLEQKLNEFKNRPRNN